MLDQLGANINERGNVATDADKMTSVPGIFAAGDMARGQSLVVWAIREGRQPARFSTYKCHMAHGSWSIYMFHVHAPRRASSRLIELEDQAFT